jgi:hypothetical protein
MANIKELIQSIESGDSSFDEKLAAINKMEETLVAMREQEQEAIDDNVELIIEALKTIEAKVEAKLRIIPEKGEQGIQGQKGEQGDRGLDGAQGRDGKSGLDGKNGLDGKDGISVQDAKIDFDGSLVITLSDGREINVGEVVPVDVAQTIHKIQSGSGGDSQTTLNAIAALQATIATYGTMATQNANNVVITGGTINGTTVGTTTPAAGTFTTLTANTTFQYGASSANYGEGTGGATTKAVEFKTLGSDTNVAYAIRTKGTGAIDLAAGSSGVNISNGGTVTAITRTSAGSAYTSQPTVAISAPTTAGGVQATATFTLTLAATPTVSAGGSGYTVGDVLTIVGGTSTQTATVTVATVSAGAVATVTISNFGVYTVAPSNPASVTGGTGTGATFNLSFGILSATITNAGSGYVEQPTVSFSGGGGSGAAAYATVGSVPKIQTLGSSLQVFTPAGVGFEVLDSSAPTTSYIQAVSGGSGQNGGYLRTNGTATNPSMYLQTKGTGAFSFFTNALVSPAQQLNVSHTASAVNYVQVTGGASGSPATVTISAQGSSTDVDFAVTPRGAGVVRFGTYTGTILTPTGYITIKDSSGTTRRLLVG